MQFPMNLLLINFLGWIRFNRNASDYKYATWQKAQRQTCAIHCCWDSYNFSDRSAWISAHNNAKLFKQEWNVRFRIEFTFHMVISRQKVIHFIARWVTCIYALYCDSEWNCLFDVILQYGISREIQSIFSIFELKTYICLLNWSPLMKKQKMERRLWQVNQ